MGNSETLLYLLMKQAVLHAIIQSDFLSWDLQTERFTFFVILYFPFFNIFNLYISKAMNKVSVPLGFHISYVLLHHRRKNALFPNSAISEELTWQNYFKCLPTLLVLSQRYDDYDMICASHMNIYIFLLFSGLAIFPKMKNVHIWQLQWSAIHFKYKFCYYSQF